MKEIVVEADIFDRIKENAVAASLGGRSHVRTSDRQTMLNEDQLVGQLGEYALCCLYVEEEFYFARRDLINQNPWVGDSGEDFRNAIDIKTSLMRRSKNPLHYRLAVRPRERHENNRYILGLVDFLVPPIKVFLVGWAYDSDLNYVESSGPFEGAYTIKAPDLRALTELQGVL